MYTEESLNHLSSNLSVLRPVLWGIVLHVGHGFQTSVVLLQQSQATSCVKELPVGAGNHSTCTALSFSGSAAGSLHVNILSE